MNRYQLMKRMLPGKSIRALLLIIATGGLTDLAAADSTSNPEFCTGCHDDQPMKGVHAGTLFGPTNKVAACIDCHGDVRDLALHEKDASDVIRFSVEANTKIANNSCLACHKPDELALEHWTHLAHGDELACSSCHNLHPVHDPVRGISKKATIKLCVDCHAEQTLAGEGVLP